MKRALLRLAAGASLVLSAPAFGGNAPNLGNGAPSTPLEPTGAAIAAPVNLAPNSQWEIWSAFGYGTAFNPDATGTVPPIRASTNTTGTLGYTTFTVAGTDALSVGDLVTVSGRRADGALTLAPMRVTALPDRTHITVRLPRGLTPTSSSATSLTPIQIGALWSATRGGGAGPDGWARYPTGSGAAPILWRDMLQGAYAVNAPRDVGALAALGVKLQQDRTANTVYIAIPSGQIANYAGKTIAFGIYGMQKIRRGAGAWVVFFQDDVRGGVRPCAASAAPVGAYAWAECSYRVPVAAKHLFVGVQLLGAPGDAYYFVDPVLTVGAHIGGVRNYVKPRNEILIPTVHIGPPFWINQTITFPRSNAMCGGMSRASCFVVDPYAETGGQIAPTVLKARGQLEGVNANPVQVGTAATRLMAWYDTGDAPQKSGSFLPQYVANVKSYMYMDYPFLTNTTTAWSGTGIFVSRPADRWTNVSMEMDEFILP